MSRFRDTNEVMWRPGRPDRIDGNTHIAIRSILETYRARQPGRHLAMHLAFSGARAYCAPRHQIRNVLRRSHVEEFARHGHPQVVELDQKLPRHPQAVVYPEAAVEAGIIYQPLPSDGGTRLLEIDAHQYDET